MKNDYFNVYVDNDCVAKNMPLQYAIILTKGIYSEFYAEPNLKVTIEKYYPNTTAAEEKYD